MPIERPKVLLRIGSHAEKEYFEKLAKNLDGILFGGNLLEITPAATASFLFLLRTRRGGKAVPFYLDPMTYCFGPYVDPLSSGIRADLDSLKSEKIIKRGEKRRRRIIKDSYKYLGEGLGPVFSEAVGDGVKCQAVDVSLMASDAKDRMCNGVLAYQWNRVAEILSEDELMQEFGVDARPAAVFAPYFFVAPPWAESGLSVAADLAARSVRVKQVAPVHAVFCGAAQLLDSEDYARRLVGAFSATGVDGVWLWFDGFDEFTATPNQLANFRTIVSGLARTTEVFNLHGGYFSLLLAHDGLTGISHGVGYGERKPVAQVIGAAAPTVRYYLPPIRMRIGVPELQLSLAEVGIETAEEFFDRVCSCQICKGILSRDLDDLSAFGEQHRTKATAARLSQTPAAAKMCRYHFLLNRLREPTIVSELDGASRATHIATTAGPWRECINLRKYLGSNGGYLERWAAALR